MPGTGLEKQKQQNTFLGCLMQKRGDNYRLQCTNPKAKGKKIKRGKQRWRVRVYGNITAQQICIPSGACQITMNLKTPQILNNLSSHLLSSITAILQTTKVTLRDKWLEIKFTHCAASIWICPSFWWLLIPPPVEIYKTPASQEMNPTWTNSSFFVCTLCPS